jgi:hypothetical protein
MNPIDYSKLIIGIGSLGLNDVHQAQEFAQQYFGPFHQVEIQVALLSSIVLSDMF